MLDPPDGVQHAHGTLHDVGQMAPADRRQLLWRKLIDIPLPVLEAEPHRSFDNPERRTDGTSNSLDEGALSRTRLACEAVDLIAVNLKADVINRPHLAVDPEQLHLIVCLQTVNFEQRSSLQRLHFMRGCHGTEPGDHTWPPRRRRRL